MWLLKLHFAFSILCIITFFGVMMFSKDVLKQNGYVEDIKGKKKIRYYLRHIRSSISLILLMFVPILNISGVIIIFQMIRMSKDEFMDWQQDIKSLRNDYRLNLRFHSNFYTIYR